MRRVIDTNITGTIYMVQRRPNDAQSQYGALLLTGDASRAEAAMS